MTTYTLLQSWASLRQALRRCAWWLGLVLMLVLVALAAYRAVEMPATVVVGRSSQTPPVNPAQQAVLDYLRAHTGEQPRPAPRAAFSPAQQGVMNYLHAHQRAEQQPAFWDQATQAVRDYLSAHSR